MCLTHRSSYDVKMNLIKYLVEERGANVTIASIIASINETPFTASAQHNNLPLVKYLVEQCGANIDTIINSNDNDDEYPLTAIVGSLHQTTNN